MTTEEIGFVIDTLAVAESRVHDVKTETGIVRYTLSAGKPTEMPMDHAMRFLCDEAFIVTDAEGKRIKPLKSTEHATNVPVPTGFVLAAYEELSRDALVIRCKLLPGSEHIHPRKTPVADMVEFLKKMAPKPEGGNELSKEQLDELFDDGNIL